MRVRFSAEHPLARCVRHPETGARFNHLLLSRSLAKHLKFGNFYVCMFIGLSARVATSRPSGPVADFLGCLPSRRHKQNERKTAHSSTLTHAHTCWRIAELVSSCARERDCVAITSEPCARVCFYTRVLLCGWGQLRGQ